MKLSSSLAALAFCGALALCPKPAMATSTLNTSVTFKLNAVIQALEESETADGFVSTTEKVTIVNKDILAAFEEWNEVTLPAGATIGMDEEYLLVILNKDGDVLYDAEDLLGFLEYQWDIQTEDGRHREKDSGDYANKFTQRATTEFLLFGTFEESTRSATLNVDTDSADLLGLGLFVYTENYKAATKDHKYVENDRFDISGAGTIEDSDATISGVVTMKYVLKDDDFTPTPLLGGAAARPTHSPGR